MSENSNKPESEIIWDLESGGLEMTFYYPEVQTRIVEQIKNKKGDVIENILDGSSHVADRAMQKHFRQGLSNVRWSYSDNGGFFRLHLVFDNKAKRMALDKFAKKINAFDQQIRKEIDALINPPYKSEK